MMNYQTQDNRESMARWQSRKANGGIQPGDNFHWMPYPKDFITDDFSVRVRCTICGRVGSNDKMQVVEVVDGGAVRCWDAEVIATLDPRDREVYAANMMPDGEWDDESDRGYMGWWFVGSECAKHLHPSLLPPQDIQDRTRKVIIETYQRKAAELASGADA